MKCRAMDDKDYGPKTGAAEDHPYGDNERAPNPAPAASTGKDKTTPPDSHTEIDSEADIDDPSDK
jgi:hypothetical protein